MLYLAFIWHMHQPYYSNLLTNQVKLPWVRLHGTKDYLDMLTILSEFPNLHQTFNLVPSLIEQINSFVDGSAKDYYLILSEKTTSSLSEAEKQFIIDNFFMADEKKVISIHPRYYELFLKAKTKKQFSNQELLDLQVWFNLAWIDPFLRQHTNELRALMKKGRFFTEEDKKCVLDNQAKILGSIVSTYKKYQDSGQIEISVSPFYHPILPLVYNAKIAKTANKKTKLPEEKFCYPDDCYWHIIEAVQFYKKHFGSHALGMWPSEQAISKQIIPLLAKANIKWIVTDETIILRTLKNKDRDTSSIYRPYSMQSENGQIDIVFRDGNLSNLISFLYQHWDADRAVIDLMAHPNNINTFFKNKDCLVVLALDGENAWEYYSNDGRDFLNLLYKTLSESSYIKNVTISEYLSLNSKRNILKRISAGSWINCDFTKWIGNPVKNKAWGLLAEARLSLINAQNPPDLAWKQIHILEGSDWFWWYGDKQRDFDELFRMHLKNFYKIIKQKPKYNLDSPLE